MRHVSRLVNSTDCVWILYRPLRSKVTCQSSLLLQNCSKSSFCARKWLAWRASLSGRAEDSVTSLERTLDGVMEEEAPADGEPETPLSAETYAAEAMAADMDPWIVFDSRNTPRSEFDGWLESNRPSQVYRFGDEDNGVNRVGWIAVLGPNHCPSTGDVSGLQESWDKLLTSSRPVTFQTVKELALNHGVLSGKWLMHLASGFKLDHAWECVARATLEGKISLVKVSPYNPKAEGKQVICAYNQNFTDEGEVVQLDSFIRATGVKCPLSYKPDVYTYLGIYRNNRWKLCPTIYESKFDLECVPRRSHIINKVTNLEVT